MPSVHRIDLNENADPTHITLRLTIREALYIAKLTGEKSATTAAATLPGMDAGGINLALFSTLAGDVFNRFWDGGVGEAEQDLR